MQTSGNAVKVEKAEKVGEKVLEKRRALGRGLESLLPSGPRAVPTNMPTLAPSARKDGAAAVGEGEAEREGRSAAPSEGTHDAVAVGEQAPAGGIDLQASAARRTADGEPVVEITVASIDENPYQTRALFDPVLIKELAESIRIHGLIQPIVVRPTQEGRYVLILGERRLRAVQHLEKLTIPAIVKRVSEQQAAEMTVIENLQREDLMCMEQARAFANLSEMFNLTQEEIGKRVGVSRETVANYLRLLRLPYEVQMFLERGELTYSHARELLVRKDDSEIVKLAQLAVKKKMSVLQLEGVVMEMDFPSHPEGEPKKTGARWVDPNVRSAQRNLEMILGMRVRIRDRRGKGKITIEYNSIEDYEESVGSCQESGLGCQESGESGTSNISRATQFPGNQFGKRWDTDAGHLANSEVEVVNDR